MVVTHIKTAYRQLLKNKAFSFINIIGLALGVAACLFILEYVIFEFSFDRFHKDAERIYRVTNDRFQNGELIQHGTITYPTIGPALKEDYTDVEAYTRLEPRGRNTLRVDDRIFVEESFYNVDEHFLSVFTFRVVAGNKETCLKDPWTIVLTKELANKYYGALTDYSSVLGKMILIGTDETPYKVTGVIENVPENSHLQFDFLVSYATLIRTWGKAVDDSWQWSNFWHYVKLKPGVDYKKFESRLDEFSDRHFKGNLVSGSVEKFFLQPLTEAHLYSDYEYEIAYTGNGKIVWSCLLIAVLVLVIAWVNYINLATARAIERAKEVGIRKTLGAYKRQLVQQFMLESALFNVLGIILAIIMVQTLQPLFNQLLNNDLSLKFLVENDLGGPAVFWLLGLGLLTGITLSGLYPAFVLSAYHPTKVLKGKLSATTQGAWLREALVVFQFTAAIIFITVTFTIYQQIQYMNNKELGMNIDKTICVWGPELTPWDSTFISKTSSFISEVETLPRVVNATTSMRLPGNRLGRIFDVRLATDSSGTRVTTSEMSIGEKFIENYGIKLIAGRAFNSSDYHTRWQDINTLILNESALKLLGLKSAEEAVGRIVKIGDGRIDWTVVGVVADFHQLSVKLPIEPIIFQPYQSNDQFISVKVENEAFTETVEKIKEKYTAFFPSNSFEYFFLDDYFNSQYSNEKLFGNVAGTFTALAIVVACLGLFGLVLFSALQRKKEVGIRKVLGATVQNLILMMSSNYVKLIIIAFIIGLPVSYLSIKEWISDYTYSIEITWMLFAVPCVGLLFVAILIMSLQTFKTAAANPVDSLRNE